MLTAVLTRRMAPPRASSEPETLNLFSVGNGMSDEPEFGGWTEEFAFQFRLRLDGDRWRLAYLSIQAKDAGSEVTASVLRSLPIAAAVAELKDGLARRLRWFTPEGLAAEQQQFPPDVKLAPWPDDVVQEARKRIRAAHRRELRGAARGRGDDFYRGIALDLIEIVEKGRVADGGVLQALATREAQRMGHEVPVQTVRTWLAKAREKGFLAPGERGRVVATPGPALYPGMTPPMSATKSGRSTAGRGDETP